MKFIPLAIPEVLLLEPTIYKDERGFFMELRHQQKFLQQKIPYQFVQDNLSRSNQGVLRGLHYQVKHPQGKLVRVLSGKVFDVAVDLRRNSPTFGRWVGAILTAENFQQMWIPPGFAHGFYVISEHADFVYCCTDFYTPEYERTILWNDPDLAIDWPLLKTTMPNLSPKDALGSLLKNAELYSDGE